MPANPTPDLKAVIAPWLGAEAPLLPMLHACHEREGCVTEDAISAVSEALDIPKADLFGTVTFYHHLSREPGGQSAPRVCTGPICCLRGAHELLASLKPSGATSMPCAGRCDAPVPVLAGNRTLVGLTGDSLAAAASPLPPPPQPGQVECVFAHIREPGQSTWEGYRSRGGYDALARALQAPPHDVIAVITASGLAGRGGAGFPTGRKWQAVADAPGTPKTIVCNADEGEPGCFKDRALLDHDPFAVIEGMTLAAYATGASRGFVYLRYEYPETAVLWEACLAAARRAGFLGANIAGTPFSFDLHLRRGAGAYICGEETSLLNSLEGKHPFPRNRPPFPVTHGYQDLPTVVNNVETLASVAPILRHGAEWYRSLGRGDHAGTKLISLSGDVMQPGNYEVPMGLPLRTLLNDWAKGPLPGRTLQAVTMAGLSGGFLAPKDFDVTLDEPSIRSRGSFLGAGGIMVFDDRRDMVEIARQAMSFFAHESCGKCFPCRIGTQRLMERLQGGGPTDRAALEAEIHDLGDVMRATSACGLGQAAPLITESLLRSFPEQWDRHFGARKS